MRISISQNAPTDNSLNFFRTFLSTGEPIKVKTKYSVSINLRVEGRLLQQNLNFQQQIDWKHLIAGHLFTAFRQVSNQIILQVAVSNGHKK